MIIFLRGLPGSGKTTVAKLLAEKLSWNVVSIDKYKKELMEQNPEANFITEIIPGSYKKAFAELKDKKENLIVEEVFRNKEFVNQLLELCREENIENKWFKITRDMSEIIKTNDERKRGIKNTPEILTMMENQLNEIVIEDEIQIKNELVEESVDEILKTLNKN